MHDYDQKCIFLFLNTFQATSISNIHDTTAGIEANFWTHEPKDGSTGRC